MVSYIYFTLRNKDFMATFSISEYEGKKGITINIRENENSTESGAFYNASTKQVHYFPTNYYITKRIDKERQDTILRNIIRDGVDCNGLKETIIEELREIFSREKIKELEDNIRGLSITYTEVIMELEGNYNSPIRSIRIEYKSTWDKGIIEILWNRGRIPKHAYVHVPCTDKRRDIFMSIIRDIIIEEKEPEEAIKDIVRITGSYLELERGSALETEPMRYLLEKEKGLIGGFVYSHATRLRGKAMDVLARRGYPVAITRETSLTLDSSFLFSLYF